MGGLFIDDPHGLKLELAYFPGIEDALNQTSVKYIGDPGPTYSEHIARLMLKYHYLKDAFEGEGGLGGSLNILRANNRQSTAAENDPLEGAFWAGGALLWRPSEHFGIGGSLELSLNFLEGSIYDVNAPFPYKFEEGDVLARLWAGLVVRTGTKDFHVDLTYRYGAALNNVDIPPPREGDPTLEAEFPNQHSVGAAVSYVF